MPKGIKSCPECGGRNGAKAHTCECGHAFQIKSRQGSVQAQEQMVDTGMGFKPRPLTSSCLSVYDVNTVVLYESEDRRYRIRFGPNFKHGSSVGHAAVYAAMFRKVMKHDLTGNRSVMWELISRHRVKNAAEKACYRHMRQVERERKEDAV